MNINSNAILHKAEQCLKNNNNLEAIKYLKMFINVAPKYHQHLYIAHYNLGRLYIDTQNIKEAIHHLSKSIELNKTFIQGINVLANLLVSIEHYQQALPLFQKALSLSQNKPLELLVGVANCLMFLKKETEAIPYFRKILELQPNNQFLLDRTAFAFYLAGEFDEALKYQLRALSLEQNAESFFNLAEIYQKMNRMEESLNSFRKALELNPDNKDFHVNYSHALLMNGDYLEGWKELEWRRKKKGLFREFPKPHWNGTDDLTNKTILLYGEQGFGDALQFVRYIPLFQKMFPNTKILLEFNKPLIPLFEKTINIPMYDYFKAPHIFDYHCSIMSLPHYLKTTLNTIPQEIDFKLDENKVLYWKNKLNTNKFKVALVWNGRPITQETEEEVKSVSARRNIPLDKFKILLDIPNIQFYSIQKGKEAEDQIKSFKLQNKIIDHTNEFNDFSDTASFIKNMDLVIGVDTAMIHLSCNLNKPTWMLSRYDGCWRWMTIDKFPTSSPWYPSIKIYRQSHWTLWDNEISEIKEDLKKLISTKYPLVKIN